MQDWLDGYEHVNVTGCTGPGTMVGGYAWKAVLHTTESNFGTMDALIRFFKANPCSCPQFAIDPGTGRKVQFIPMSWSAAALRGGRNGYETNRGCAIQVEIVGRAQETAGWSDEVLAFVASWVADIVKAGAPINIDQVADFDLKGTVATENSPYRMSPEAYKHFNGIMGHVHAPFNDHYDPFRLDIHKIVDFAHVLIDDPSYVPEPVVVSEPVVEVAVPLNSIAVGMVGGVVKFAQQLLIGLGYDLGAAGDDGDFGSATESAVKKFQSDHGLVADGVWGPLTRDAVAAAYAVVVSTPEPSPITPAPEPVPVPVESPLAENRAKPTMAANTANAYDEVVKLQDELNACGQGLAVDGVFGAVTEVAVRNVQSFMGIEADGVYGPVTARALSGFLDLAGM